MQWKHELNENIAFFLWIETAHSRAHSDSCQTNAFSYKNIIRDWIRSQHSVVQLIVISVDLVKSMKICYLIHGPRIKHRPELNLFRV